MFREFESTIDAQGHFDIPSDVRQRHGLNSGARVRIAEYGDRIVVEAKEHTKLRRNVTDLTGILGKDSKALDILIDERRKDRESEDRPIRS